MNFSEGPSTVPSPISSTVRDSTGHALLVQECRSTKAFRREPPPTVLLDRDSSEGVARFGRPERVITAHSVAELSAAFEALAAAQAAGRHLAGWLAYELGYALETRLAPLFWTRSGLPLLWFGVYGAPKNDSPENIAAHGRAYAGPLRHDWIEAQYGARFDRTKAYIAAGDIYQANLSFRSRFHFAGDPLALFLALRDAAHAHHCAFVDMGDRQILSLSPELFFRISSDGRITARPMKGTAPRGRDAETDACLRQSLFDSPKNRAENLMIVDLLRNDLGRIAEIGSIKVPELFAVETYPTLHTMVSTVEGRLRPQTAIEALLRAVFPCGSVTGAPKIRAMEIIRELEEDPRGIYCGAVGHIAPDGAASFNVAIRTIMIEGHRGALGLGGAVVQDSVMEEEYAECLLKGRFFETARRPIGLIETLRWDGRFVRLEQHLDRMSRSAAEFDIPFDRENALLTLNRAVKRAPGVRRVRLLLEEDGHFTCATTELDSHPERWSFAISPHRVSSNDPFLRHKTTWREFFDQERERLSQSDGADEALFLNERGEVTEGSRTNIFLRRGKQLLTPAVESGLLPGILRAALLDDGRCQEGVITRRDLETADEILLGNSLRGLVPAEALHAYR